MIFQQITRIGCLALALIACDSIDNKDNRSSGDDQAVAVGTPVEEGDATAAESEVPQEPAVPTVDPSMALRGKNLYTRLCASCHQPLNASNVAKTSMSKLTIAIANEPTMAGLKDIAEQDLEAIIAALGAVSPGKGKGKPSAAKETGVQ